MDSKKVNKAYWLEGGRNKILELEKKRDEKIEQEKDNIRLKNRVFRSSSADVNKKLVSLMLPHYEWLYKTKTEQKLSYERVLKSVISSHTGIVIFIKGGFFKEDIQLNYESTDSDWLYLFKKFPCREWSKQFKLRLLLVYVKNSTAYFKTLSGILPWGSGNYSDYFEAKTIFADVDLYEANIKFSNDYWYSEMSLLGYDYASELVKNTKKEQAEKEALEQQKQLEREQQAQEEKERPIREENELLRKKVLELNEQTRILISRIERNKKDIAKSTKALKKLSSYLEEKKEAYNRISYKEKRIFEELGKNE